MKIYIPMRTQKDGSVLTLTPRLSWQAAVWAVKDDRAIDWHRYHIAIYQCNEATEDSFEHISNQDIWGQEVEVGPKPRKEAKSNG